MLLIQSNQKHIEHLSTSPNGTEDAEKSKIKYREFPGGTVVGSPPANAGDTGSSPDLGGSHMPRSN